MNRRLPQILAVVACVVGMDELYSWRQGPQEPHWVASLKPLRFCPLSRGQEVIVLLPAHLEQTQKEWVLMELFWQYPNVRWQLAKTSRKARGWLLVAPGAAPVNEIKTQWQRDGWSLAWLGPLP